MNQFEENIAKVKNIKIKKNHASDSTRQIKNHSQINDKSVEDYKPLQ